MPFGPFISQEEKNRTNAALQQNYGKIEIPTTFDVAGVTYDMKTRQPVNQSQPVSRIGGRSAVRAAERKAAEERAKTPYVPPASTTPTSGGGRRRRGAAPSGDQFDRFELPSFLTPKPRTSASGGSRNRFNTKNDSEPTGNSNPPSEPEVKPTKNTGSSALPSLKPGDDIPASQYPAGVTAPSGRGSTRTSPTGVVQTGTQTGLKPMTMDDANALLSPGFSVQNPYDSTQLPTTGASLYTKDPSTVTFETGGIEGINSGQSTQRLTKDLFSAGGAVEFTEATPGMPTSAAIEATQTEGGANLVQSGAEGKTDWLNRSVMDNSDENVRRRAAMLDDYNDKDGNPVSIMERMRNQEAIQGRVYAGGQHYQVNPMKGQEGENDFIKIDAAEARGRSYGTKSANDIKDRYVASVKEGMKSGELPANIPNLDVKSEQPATVSPVDTSTEQAFTMPGDDYEPTSTRRKGGMNLFR